MYVFIIPLLLGWFLDFLFGDPRWLPHPVVYMGKWISYWERMQNKGGNRKVKGAVFAVTSVLFVFILNLTLLFWEVYLLSHFDNGVEAVAVRVAVVSFNSLCVFFCLAGHTLRKEVKMVFEALDESLEKGRRQVARIVGRDTQHLSAQEVHTAALETLAENLSDGVVAPLFWFLLLGLPGMFTYKMVNTMDSMIGYRSERYKDYGCWAAHLDDIANFIPARLTAFLLTICGWCLLKVKKINLSSRSLWKQFKFVCHYGPQHLSPNSGWPEASLAGLLDCRFGGSHSYFGKDCYKPFIGENPRTLNTADMTISVGCCLFVEVVCVGLVGVLGYFI
ncbi:MAG: cobalamin biosynthesis protein CobD [Bacteroidales bacterium]|nr:cobalamin biosynthesis protein CobD [Bacteroidales bacterium]